MLPEFYYVYRDLYEIYQTPTVPFTRRLSRFLLEKGKWPFEDPRIEVRRLSRIREEIDRATSRLGLAETLRPDARYFLLINLDRMVALPFSHPAAAQKDAEAIMDAIRQDVSAILETAVEEAKGDEEISGGAVLRATASIWDKLRINRWKVWN